MRVIKLALGAAALLFIIMVTPNKSAATSSATGPQPWGEFSFGDVGSFADTGVGFVPSIGGNSFFLDTPPWTFTGSGFLIVQDAFFTGDQFRVFDNDASIGDTSLPVTSTDGCGSNPVDCFADPRASHGIFTLGTGDHSFTIQMLLSPHFDQFGEGAAYFCIDTGAGNCGVGPISGDHEVPEPDSILLLGLSLVAAYCWAMRRRISECYIRIQSKRRRR